MSSQTVLSKSLIISIVIILVGIMMIIFIPFEPGNEHSAKPLSLRQQQNNLIDHVYKSQPNNPSTEIRVVPAILKTAAENYPLSEVQIPRAERPLTRQPFATRNNVPYYQYGDPGYTLRNNPWSPYYDPQY